MANASTAVQDTPIAGRSHGRARRNPERRMPLMQHLRELRNRLVKSVLVIIAAMIVALVFSSQTLDIVARPFCSTVINGHSGCQTVGDQLVINGVFDGFFLRVKIAFFFALIGTCPVWLYQLWAFIAPGLYAREKKWAYLFTFTAVPLFTGGALLAYLVMGRGLRYLLALAPQNSLILPSWDTYLGYFTGILLGFGIVFEIPLMIIMLNLAGVLTHERFRRWRRALIFGIFVVAGIVNPSPDPWTMLILGGLAVVLVEAAEIFVYVHDKRRARLSPDPYANLADHELSPLQPDGREKG